MQQRSGNRIQTTTYDSEPIRKMKYLFYFDIGATIIYLLHFLLFWTSYKIPFDFRMFLGIFSFVTTIGLIVLEFIDMYKKSTSGRIVNQNLIPWVRVGVWAIVLLYAILLIIWVSANFKTWTGVKGSFKFGYWLTFVVLVLAVLILVSTYWLLQWIRLHNLSLVGGARTHIVKYEMNNQNNTNYNQNGYNQGGYNQGGRN